MAAARPPNDPRHDERPSPAPEASEAERVSRHKGEGTLGYAQSAGHPGGEQDLDAKTESEEEHEETA
jgi:hypothetical protein